MIEWIDTDKAAWILENGQPDIKWVYERVDEQVYRRPFMGDPDSNVPPWIDTKREKYYNIRKAAEGNSAHEAIQQEFTRPRRFGDTK